MHLPKVSNDGMREMVDYQTNQLIEKWELLLSVILDLEKEEVLFIDTQEKTDK